MDAAWVISYRIDRRLGPEFLCAEELAAIMLYGRGGKRHKCELHK